MLHGDDARLVKEQWLPYILRVAQTKMSDAAAASFLPHSIEKDNGYLKLQAHSFGIGRSSEDLH